jgi:leucyl-tRNA synthetase
MELRNSIEAASREQNVAAVTWDEAIDSLLLLLAPFAPYISEELWSQRGYSYSIHRQEWPDWDAEVVKEEEIDLIVQVNGKVRDRIQVAADISDADAEAAALASEKIQERLDGRQPRKVILVRGRLVNIVV